MYLNFIGIFIWEWQLKEEETIQNKDYSYCNITYMIRKILFDGSEENEDILLVFMLGLIFVY